MDDYKEAHEVLELRELLGFKQIVTAPQYFATMDLRLLAVMIDIVLIGTIYAVAALILIIQAENRNSRIIIVLAGFIAVPVLKFIYAVFMEASQRQATFGKLWLGFKNL